MRWPDSLRSQIVGVLVLIAILPLALVGVWVSRSAVRSGESLLHGHLEASANGLARAIEARWDHRRGDIDLIAGNEATRRAVLGRAGREDVVYLEQLAQALAPTIVAIELRDAAGGVRWAAGAPRRATAAADRAADPVSASSAGITISVDRPIRDGKAMLGSAHVEVAVDAVVPGESSRPLVPGAAMGVRIRGAELPAVAVHPAVPFPAAGRASIDGEDWLVVQRSVEGPGLDIVVAAPLAPYTRPFAAAFRVSLGVLALVALAAGALAMIFAARTTRPLEDLAAAASAVSRGQLGVTVAVAGPREVSEVGQGFNHMTEHLRQTLDELARRSALAAVGEFATSLSHDVRNALTSVHLDLDRAARRRTADPVAAKLIDRSLGNVGRVEAIVTGALRVARTGVMAEELDLRQPVRLALEMTEAAFAAIPARVYAFLPDSPVIVRGDATALQQVFANLLFNSAQAMGPESELRMRFVIADDSVEVRIADQGRGIDPETLARLERGSYSSRRDGSGFGLPIVRRIVSSHGGMVALDGQPGVGTTAVVSLPLLNDSINPIERNEPRGHPAGASAS